MDILVALIIFLLMLGSTLLIIVGMPGVLFIAILFLVSGIYFGTSEISMWLIVAVLIIAALVETFDVFATSLGAKKFGGSNLAAVGAVLCSLVALFTGNLLLLLIAPLVGATLIELIIARKDFRSSFKVGLGTFIGYLTSVFFKVIIAVTLIVVWLVAYISN